MAERRRIAFAGLDRQYVTIADEIQTALKEVLDSQRFIKGPFIQRFETAFGEIYGQPAVACASGSAALYLALRALGVGPGDEVVLPANTFIATAEAVSLTGARPVFADVDSRSHNMTVATIRPLLSAKTRALIPVHLYGNPCEMPAIADLCHDEGLWLVEDCAQAHLATIDGRLAGSFGDAAAFSFFPGKNLGAFGDAGLVLTLRPELAERVRRLADHGRTDKYHHDSIGFNLRMAEIQAAVLGVKLPRLSSWTSARRAHASHYLRRLATVQGLQFPTVPHGAEPAYHLFVVALEERDRVRAQLDERGITTGVHYPLPLHLQPAYAALGVKRGDLPNAERLAGRILSLPMYPELTVHEVDYVCDSLVEVLS